MFAHTNHLLHQLTVNRSLFIKYLLKKKMSCHYIMQSNYMLLIISIQLCCFFCKKTKKKPILNENLIKWSEKFVYFSLSLYLMHHFNSHGERTLVWVYLFYPKNKFLYSMALNLCQCYKFSFFPSGTYLDPFCTKV